MAGHCRLISVSGKAVPKHVTPPLDLARLGRRRKGDEHGGDPGGFARARRLPNATLWSQHGQSWQEKKFVKNPNKGTMDLGNELQELQEDEKAERDVGDPDRDAKEHFEKTEFRICFGRCSAT